MIQQSMSASQWCTKQLLLPVLVGVIGLTLINLLHIDLLLAKWLFNAEGGIQWSLRHQMLFERVLHNGGKDVVSALSILLLAALVFSQLNPQWRGYRRSLLMMALSVASTVLLVRYGKSLTNVSCPWDLAMFGGNKPFVAFPDTLFSQQVLGQCYPGGHSSGAFAWIVLYYFGLVHKSEWRKQLLLLAVAGGAIFAMTQELRGAHFLSHDLTSLWLSWLIATSCYGVLYRPWQASSNTAAVNDVSPSLKLVRAERQA